MVPNEENFPRMCGQEDWAVKEAWEGRGPAEHKCDLAQGARHHSLWMIIQALRKLDEYVLIVINSWFETKLMVSSTLRITLMQKQQRLKACYIKSRIHMYTEPTVVYTCMLHNL